MKISQAQKEKNRQALLRAAVAVMTKEGIKKTTMKAIAHQAKLSEPVIYKYFPTKESLLYGYFQWRLDEAIQSVLKNPEFSNYTFAEQIQSLLETQLELFEPDREFIKMAYNAIFVSTLTGSLTDLQYQKEAYVGFVKDALAAAVHAKEFQKLPLDAFLADLLWDYHVGIVYYWLNDSSANYANTTQLIDKTLALCTEVLRTQLLSRAMDIVYFLMRQHLFSGFAIIDQLSPPQREAKQEFYARKAQIKSRRNREKN